MSDKKAGEVPDNTSVQDGRIEALEARIEALEQAPANTSVQDGRIESLEARIEVLEQTIVELFDKVASLSVAGKSAGSALILTEEAAPVVTDVPFDLGGAQMRLSIPAIRYNGRRITGADLAADAELAVRVQADFPHLVVPAQ